MVRAFTPDDVEQLKMVHAKYFAHEFQLPDFLNYIFAFVVQDEWGIVTFGGIRDIAECITVTDRSRSAKDKVVAMYQVLNTSVSICKSMGYDQIYAWSQVPQYARQLKKYGFRPPDGESLIFDL